MVLVTMSACEICTQEYDKNREGAFGQCKACHANGYQCIKCGDEIDETEFSYECDANICCYCFSSKVSEIEERLIPWPPKLGIIGKTREIAHMADVEIRLEVAKREGDHRAIAIYGKMLRMLEA